jgi:phosphomannomutase
VSASAGDPSGDSAPQAIRFGTSGWRGVLGEEFTFERARALVRAVADHVRDAAAGTRVVVAHDTRFLGDRLAAEAAAVLRAGGLQPLQARGPLPTPVACFAVRRRRAALGLVFTASHNPPEYQGLKVIAPWGGAAPGDLTRSLERRAATILAAGAPPRQEAPARAVDFVAPYLEALIARLDPAALRRARVRVVYDALHGAGAGVLDRVLERAGARVELRRAAPDPAFGGGPPDPVPARLGDLALAVRSGRGLRLGVATDGDADRFALVDERGRMVGESEALALLVDHLARTGRVRRGVALSLATGSLAERVARAHGLAVERHPIGFKHLTRALLDGRADVAGEESGGFAWAPFARDKDGVLGAALAVEMLAGQRTSLADRLRALWRAHGRSASGRTAVAVRRADPHAVEAVERMLGARLDGARVLGVSREDGVRVALEDGFLMWRASGTEPVLRVYADAPDRRRLARRLAAGVRLLRASGVRRSAR